MIVVLDLPPQECCSPWCIHLKRVAADVLAQHRQEARVLQCARDAEQWSHTRRSVGGGIHPALCGEMQSWVGSSPVYGA